MLPSHLITQEHEHERKFDLLNNTLFSRVRDILVSPGEARHILDFYDIPHLVFGTPHHKDRQYRYFDTAESSLRKNNVTCSLRDRGSDYVLTVKLPLGLDNVKQREEHSFSFPAYGNFHTLDITIQKELSSLLEKFTQGSSLVDSLTLFVHTDGFNVFQGKNRIALLSLDQIFATIQDYTRIFYELEIERKDQGTATTLDTLANALQRTFELQEVTHSKYERALILLGKT